MSIVKLDCGCKHNTATLGYGEVWIELCVQHAKDFNMRHEAAAASCSHANRDLVDTE